jgi:hypothetical protein
VGDFLKSLIAMLIAFVIFTFPATWLFMLFAGNVGWGWGYMEVLPLGILISVLLGGVTSRTW